MCARFASPRTLLGALISAASLAGFVACAPPLILRTASTPPPTDTVGAAPERVTVEVRYFPFSPTVAVVAWAPAEAAYGLRAWIRRDGSLIRDHRLYVSTYYEPAVRAFPQAVVPSKPLLVTGISHDIYACYFGDSCSPPETFGARVPDEVLRGRDSVAVKFYGRGGRELVVTIRRDLIDAYVAAVDSVSAALRRRT